MTFVQQKPALAADFRVALNLRFSFKPAPLLPFALLPRFLHNRRRLGLRNELLPTLIEQALAIRVMSFELKLCQ
jgi:hypothetical protein